MAIMQEVEDIYRRPMQKGWVIVLVCGHKVCRKRLHLGKMKYRCKECEKRNN